MIASRRNWLKTIGLLGAGSLLPLPASIASPLDSFFPDAPAGGPVRLSSNENPYGPSPKARLAMTNSSGIANRYQWSMIRELNTMLAAKYKLADGNVLPGAGSTQIIDHCIQYAALKKGNVVIAEPTFSRWTGAAEKNGLQIISVPLTKDKRHDLHAMKQAVTKDTRMVYLCNPNNPTGTVCTNQSLTDFIRDIPKEILILVDEAYIDYTKEPSLASMVTALENLIIIKTFSKIYGLAGARIGYALAHTKTIEQMSELQSGSSIAIGALSLAAAQASLMDEDFYTSSYEQNIKARTYTIEQLEKLNIKCVPSSTNFIYFSLASYQKDFFALLKTNNIEGTGIFEEDGKWSRITVGTMTEMQQFITAIS
jgi:histidinol-phosphate aminotransferase